MSRKIKQFILKKLSRLVALSTVTTPWYSRISSEIAETNRLVRRLIRSGEAASGNRSQTGFVTVDSWVAANPCICHAMGMVDAVPYTNSLDAFMCNYNSGFRAFELDVSLTSDFVPVITHDWLTFNRGNLIFDMTKADFSRVPHILDYDEFKSIKVLGKYTTLSLRDVVNLGEKYGEAYFIVSVKTDKYQYDSDARLIFSALSSMIEKSDKNLYNHFIPQVHGFNYAYRVMDEFDFPSLLYGQRYENDFGDFGDFGDCLRQAGIGVVACYLNDLNKEKCTLLHRSGVKVIAFTAKSKSDADLAKGYGSDAVIADTPLM
jgi:glycerophosphoryl diester phosphodiesterase